MVFLNGTFTSGAAKAVAITWYAADGMVRSVKLFSVPLN